MEPTAVGYINR